MRSQSTPSDLTLGVSQGVKECSKGAELGHTLLLNTNMTSCMERPTAQSNMAWSDIGWSRSLRF